MYIECKPDGIRGEARIGRVTFSKTGRSMYYDGKEFLKVKDGFKYNCIEVNSGGEYWISGCKKNDNDTLYGSNKPVEIDADVQEEYWVIIRNRPDLKSKSSINYLK
jgi:hypothetical protein